MKRTYGGKRASSAAPAAENSQQSASSSLPDIMMGLPDASPSRPRVSAAVQLALQKPALPRAHIAAVAATTLRSSGARTALQDEISFQLDGLEASPRVTSVSHASLRALARLFSDPSARDIGRQRSVMGRLLRVAEGMAREGLDTAAATAASSTPTGAFRLHWQTATSTAAAPTSTSTAFDFPAASGLLLLLLTLDSDAQCVDIITPHVLTLAVRTGVAALCVSEALDEAWAASASSCEKDFPAEAAAYRETLAHTCTALLQRAGVVPSATEACSERGEGSPEPRKRARLLLGKQAAAASEAVIRTPDEAGGDRHALFRDMVAAGAAPAGVATVLDVAVRLCHRVTHAFDEEHAVATGDDAAFIAKCVKDVRDALCTCANGVAHAWLSVTAALDYMCLRDRVRGRSRTEPDPRAAQRLSDILAIVEDVTCMSEAHTRALLRADAHSRAPWLQTQTHARGWVHPGENASPCEDAPAHCSGVLAVVAGLVLEHPRGDMRGRALAELLAASLRVCVNLSNHQREAAQTLAHTQVRATSTRGAPATDGGNVFDSILDLSVSPHILPRTYTTTLPHFDTLVHALSVCANVCEHSHAARRRLLHTAVSAYTHTLCAYAHDDDVHADDVALCAYLTLTLVCVCANGDDGARAAVLQSLTASSGRCACASVDLMQRVLTAFALMQARAGVYTQEARAHVNAAADTLANLRVHAISSMCKNVCKAVSTAAGVDATPAPRPVVLDSSSDDDAA